MVAVNRHGQNITKLRRGMDVDPTSYDEMAALKRNAMNKIIAYVIAKAMALFRRHLSL